MNKIIYICLSLTTIFPVFAREQSSDGKFCQIMKDWKSHEFTPKKLCQKYRGSFCLSVETDDQTICAAAGKSFCTDIKAQNLGGGICKAGDGSFCDDLKSIGGGLCSVLGGSFCDDIVSNSENELKWFKKLNQTCY